MSFNHSVSDLVSRLRNGYLSKKDKITVPCSKIRENILSILKEEGFILGYSRVEGESFNHFNISLSYKNYKPSVNEISVISKPGRRIYSSYDNLPLVKNGLGMIIISSSKGVITDHQAREMKVGGEVLMKIF
jgi:small subunit ribosomal protein S8